MPYLTVINHCQSLSVSDKMALTAEFDRLRAELDNIRSEYGTLLAQLDADAGVTGTNFAANNALAAAQFTRT